MRIQSTVALLLGLLMGAAAASNAADDETSSRALGQFLMDEMANYRTGTSGSSTFGERLVHFEVGSRPEPDGHEIRAMCGTPVDGEAVEDEREEMMAVCKRWLLRTIAQLSQPTEPGPYRAAGDNEIVWHESYASIASGHLVYVLDGRHALAKGSRPCRWVKGCCDINGIYNLVSCRKPTESEWQAIDYCRAEGFSCRTEPYLNCLREQGVKVGCEDQPDGSRICY